MNNTNDREKRESASCARTNMHGLFLPNRQASAVVAGIVALISISFMTGYFFGKKQGVEEFTNKVDRDHFADQIFSSLCALSDQDPQEVEVAAIQSSEQVSTIETENQFVTQAEEQTSAEGQQLISRSEPDEQCNDGQSKQYYAQLIGFGTAKAAQNFANKLQKKGMPVMVKARRSTTAKGRKISWYQVATQSFDDRQELENLVDRISKEETLKGVRIVAN